MVEIKILNKKSMSSIQMRVYLALDNEYFMSYENPKNQPFFSKNGWFSHFLSVKMVYIKILNKKSMISIQMRVYLALDNEYLMSCKNPKN